MESIVLNDSIPRTMTREGLEYLGRLAKLVPPNGLIVEVGPLFGSSTWVLAKNAHPSVRVISIDTWEKQDWIDAVESKYPGCRPFSKDAFDYYVRDCPNVEARQGFSPEIMKGWDEPIDLFFDDATHGNPGFSESLNFYLPKLKSGGIACGDDFAVGWPDIIKEVYNLSLKWQTRPEVIGRVWAAVKPKEGLKPPSIYDLAGPYSSHDISISVRRFGSMTEEIFSPGSWAGRLHGTDPIAMIKFDWAQPREHGLDGVVQVRSGKGNPSGWHSFGSWLGSPNKPIVSIRAHLSGPRSSDFRLSYQTCSIIAGRRGAYTRNSRAFRDGDWLTVESDHPPKGISALRCVVERVSNPY